MAYFQTKNPYLGKLPTTCLFLCKVFEFLSFLTQGILFLQDTYCTYDYISIPGYKIFLTKNYKFLTFYISLFKWYINILCTF
jgi:hypothetical protein